MARPRSTNKHLPKYVREHHGSWWFRPPNGGNVKVCKVGDYPALYKYLADKLDPISNDELTTLNKCFDRYDFEIIPQLAPGTQKSYRQALRYLREAFGHMHPNDVRPRDVGRFLDVAKGRVTKNRQVAVLSAVYTKCVGRWYVADRNPCIGVERHKARKRSRYITDDEYKTVWDAMPPRIRLAMDLALLTGQRQGDLLNLKWEAVSPAGIYFRQGKTGKRLLVETSPELAAVLDRARKMAPQIPNVYVIRKRLGDPYSSEGFRAIWQRYMRRLVRSQALRERFTFHDIRAKSVSDAATLNEAFERAGHTSMAMTRGVYDRGIRKVKPLR